MDSQIDREMLIFEIHCLSSRCYKLGGGIPHPLHDDVLASLDDLDLQDLKKRLRDLVHSLGVTRD